MILFRNEAESKIYKATVRPGMIYSHETKNIIPTEINWRKLRLNCYENNWQDKTKQETKQMGEFPGVKSINKLIGRRGEE